MKFLPFLIFCFGTSLYAAPLPGSGWSTRTPQIEKNVCRLHSIAASFFTVAAMPDAQIITFVADTLLAADTAGNPSAKRKQDLKYFPSLLKDNMSINFDPNKYRPLKAITIDSSTFASTTQTALNKNSKNTIATNNEHTATLPTLVKDTAAAAFTQRTTNLIHTFLVNSPHISIQLFDDGQIDGDAVSVYYNGKIIINNQTLSHKALTFDIEASAASRHHELTLVAESEGMVPPNTALLRIKAGSQQFELNVSSSSASNAKIAIDYAGE